MYAHRSSAVKTVDERMVEVNGVRLWTARQGSGPPVVLLHGGPGLWDDFDDLAAMVDDLVEVYRYDQRGSGRSASTPPYDVATFIARLNADWGRLLHEGRLPHAARSITAPTLVLHGRDDPRPPRVAQRLVATMPTAKLVVIPACGHMPWLERPEVVRHEVRAFLSKVTRQW
jgi:pimeloyl-ACP methyl ester carboxylesterase